MPQDEERSRDGRDDGELSEALVGVVKGNKELLASAAISAAGAVAASKGPQLVRRLTEATEDRGEQEAGRLGEKAAEGAKQSLGGGAGIAGKAFAKAIGGGGGSDGKKTRRLPIQRWTDVAVPVDKAYQAWTKFDEFPKFMHRVLDVKKEDTNKIHWREKIWFSTREWDGEITERRKNDRIAWKSVKGTQHSGL